MRTNPKPENNRGNPTPLPPKNRGYDPEVFTVHRASKEIALLPGIGRFCACGCGKPIRGKLVTHIIHGKPVEIYHNPRHDQRWASKKCKDKVYHKQHPVNWDKIRINCSLMLRVESNGKIPYRILKLHMRNHNDVIDIKITSKSNPEIWNICEKIARYRTDPLKMEEKACAV